MLYDLGDVVESPSELIVFGPYLFAIHHAEYADVIAEYFKDTGQLIEGGVVLTAPGTLSRMQYDGRFLYWMNGADLWLNDTTNGAQRLLVSNINAYLASGYGEECDPNGCTEYAFVTYAERSNPQGNRLLTQEVFSGSTTLEFTAAANAEIGPIVRDATNYFFFERRPTVGGGPFDRDDRLRRLSVGSNTPVTIYGPVLNTAGFEALATDFTHLYFRSRSFNSLIRLPNDSAAMPVRSLSAYGLEISQSILDVTNLLPLIEGRRTFVRFYVRSNGLTDVPGVSASLNVSDNGSFLGTLEPINWVGKLITVKTNPRRANINDSFLFELPLSWVKAGSRFTLTATLNPRQLIEEDSYLNNANQLVLNKAVQVSPRLPLEIITWQYHRNPDTVNVLVSGNSVDNEESVYHLKQLYPISQTGGPIGIAGPGLRLATRTFTDDTLWPHVNRTDANCIATRPVADRNLCAADFVAARIRAMRAARELPNDRYYYSAISRDAVTPFTRGHAIAAERVASGPIRDPSPQQNYMSHEVGHLLNRDHPDSGAGVCPGQVADGADDFPNPNARIGNSTTLPGNENADMGLGVTPQLFGGTYLTTYPASLHGDTMSYCRPYWISAHNHNELYDFMIANPLTRSAAVQRTNAKAIAGDWLLVFGNLSAANESAAFLSVKHLNQVAEIPALVNGGYALELLNSNGQLLASHGFTPESVSDTSSDIQTFGLVVPFQTGTRTLRIVQTNSGKIFADHTVSNTAPTISNVNLIGLVEPVSGSFTVSWQASDGDGDTLTFDVFYSIDNGNNWQPLLLSAAASPVNIDADQLPGGSARLRVSASDGTHTIYAESNAFQVARKPPLVRIETPADDFHISWGQLINFIAYVEDPQGSEIPTDNMVWSNAYRELGTGPSISVTDLEVGTNPITLSVTDSQGMVSSDTITVHVGDPIQPPGSRISASPLPIAWQVAGDSNVVLETDLSVNNAGAGVLTFTATSGAPWLRINNAASITTSADVILTVTADTSVFTDLSYSEATIQLSNSTDPSDIINVPVSVAKGDLFGGQSIFGETIFIDNFEF